MADEARGYRRYLLVAGVLALVVVVVALFAIDWTLKTTQKDARLAGLPIPVQTVAVAVKSLNETIGASGTIQPSMPINLTAKVVARVLAVRVEVGATVKPGDVLVELDPQLYQANLATAQVSLEHAEKQLARMKALAKKNFAAAIDVENAQIALATAQAAVVTARINLLNTRILSSVPAVVLAREINPGEMTKLDETLIQLGVVDPIEMDAAVSEDKIGQVYLDMPADVGTDAFPGETFHGRVFKMDSIVNDTTRTFGAYVRLANHDLRLKKGVTGYARLHSDRMGLAVPSTAIINPLSDRAAVFVVGDDHRAHLRPVRVGVEAEGYTEIVSGLREGEQVVTVGQFDLHDNDQVRVNQSAPWNK